MYARIKHKKEKKKEKKKGSLRTHTNQRKLYMRQ